MTSSLSSSSSSYSPPKPNAHNYQENNLHYDTSSTTSAGGCSSGSGISFSSELPEPTSFELLSIDAGKTAKRLRTLSDEIWDEGKSPTTLLYCLRNAVGNLFHKFTLGKDDRKALFSLIEIRDYNGISLLEQAINHFLKVEYEYKGIDLLEKIEAALTCLQSAKERAEETEDNTDYIALENTAKSLFTQLDLSFQGALCLRLWMEAGKPDVRDYGLKQIKKNPSALLKVIPNLLVDLRNSVKAPLELNDFYKTRQEKVHRSDSSSVIADIRKIYQLEDFEHFLNDSYKYADFIFSKFEQLDQELQHALLDIVSIALDHPVDRGFAMHIMRTNPHVILQMKNEMGKTVLSQIISHYQAKIKCMRRMNAVEKAIDLVLSSKEAIGKEKDAKKIRKIRDELKKNLRPLFSKLDSKSKKFLKGQSKANPEDLAKMDGPLYSTLEVFRDQSTSTTLWNAIEELRKRSSFPLSPITDVSPNEKYFDYLPETLKVVMATAELGKVSVGGLGVAVDGLARALGAGDAVKTRVIIPYYRPIENLPQDWILHEKKKYEFQHLGKTWKVFKSNVNGLRVYLLDNKDNFTIGAPTDEARKQDSASGMIYGGHLYGNEDRSRERWAMFQTGTVELMHKFYKLGKVNLAHFHEAQTGLCPILYSTRYPEDDLATFFTYHNTLSAVTFQTPYQLDTLRKMGHPAEPTNSLASAIANADMVSTVSEDFARQSQMNEMGRSAYRQIQKAALTGRLVGIPNGTNGEWDPRTCPGLKKWKTASGEIIDLTYGPDSLDLEEKKIRCKKEFCSYVNTTFGAKFKPENPTAVNFGRLDTSQKGVHHFKMMMKEFVKNGIQVLIIGTDPNCSHTMNNLLKEAEKLKDKGVLFLIDKKIIDENGVTKYQYQNVLGPIMRAAGELFFFPSEFEPFGLVVPEAFSMGGIVVATKTGGFNDMLSGDPDHYFIQMAEKWRSKEQITLIKQALKAPSKYAIELCNALHGDDEAAKAPYIQQMRRIMRKGLSMTWVDTPDPSKLPPIEAFEAAYGQAFYNHARSKVQGKIPTTLHLLKG